MKIAVLGGAGFIGRAIMTRLVASGHDVVAFLRRPRPQLAAPSHVADFTDPAHFRDVLKNCDWLLHAAAGSTPGSTVGRPRAEHAANLAVSLALVEALQETPSCRVLYLSSGGTVYGDCGAQPADENRPLRPRSYHGAAKAAVEMFLSAYTSQYGGAVVVLRPSNVYGPGQGPRSGFGIIPTAMSAVLSGTPITIWGDGCAVRDYLYIDDLLDLLQLIVSSNVSSGFSVYNAASGKPVRIVDLLDLIEATSGRRLERIFVPERRVDVQSIAPSPQAARQGFGWRAKTSLAQGLAATWAWFVSSRV